MNKSRLFLAGVFGAAVMSLLFGLGRALGVSVNLAALLGSMFTGSVGGGTWVLGLVVHFAIGGLFGLLYGAIFTRTLARASIGAGAALGAVHAVIAGLLLAVVPAIHPYIPSLFAAPGIFLFNLGAGAAVFFIAGHILFGMIVGGAYEPRTVPVTQQRMAGAHAHT